MDVLSAAWAACCVVLCGSLAFCFLRKMRRPALNVVVAGVAVMGLALAVGVRVVEPADAAVAPVGEGFTVTSGDLKFILKQIKIAERHAQTLTPANPCGTLVGSAANQIPDRLTSWGLRTVDGSCNNLFPGRETFAAADQPFPRLAPPDFNAAEGIDANFFGPGSPAVASSSYAQKKGNVFDSQPRIASNLIVDQTSTNPAAIAAAAFPVRTQGNPGLHPCTTDPEPDAVPPVDGVPAGCVPSRQTLFIPNVTTDVGLSPPYNSLFTFFGQFFDHGVDQTVKGGGTVYVPLKADDPLIAGKDHILGNADDLSANLRFMVLTRAQNQPGPDGKLSDDTATAADETADNIQDANNTDSPWVDQSQTYTSHASHQVFLREYAMVAGKPVNTGKLLGGIGNGATGMSTWQSTKIQAETKLGLKLADIDVLNIPMIASDPYGNFIPGPSGLPQYVTTTGLVEGNLTTPVPVPANVRYFDTPFLTDIAHNADPSPQDTDHDPGTAKVAPAPDGNNTPSADFASQAPGTYDDEMLDAHFTAGDGRVNENIALTTVHQIFHSEHDRLVDDIKNTLNTAGDPAALAEWKLATGADGWNGDRLFQAARFVTEMEYQHLVFEEFGRKVQPGIKIFHVYEPDINPAIPAEFAHAVYRFGHSMLDDTVARSNEDPTSGAITDNSVSLLKGFLNPPEYFNNGSGTYSPEQAAGAIVMGSSDQVGNELDEFVTETLRNNLLGLPLDLPTLNMARARDAGVPSLNNLRKKIFASTNDGQLAPYTSWSDFGQHLKHPESLINFVAVYGKHPSITGTLAQRRAAAKAIVDPSSAPATNPTDIPDDAADFMFSNGTTWGNTAAGVSRTGVDEVDLWVGGLAELTNVFGGLLGSTFNYVFQGTMENLQDGDRFYYLNRTPGMNLRAALEGNSFSELIQRNTDGTHTLKADAFATADCKFELKNLAGTPAGFGSFGSTVADDGNSDCSENLLLLRKPDGTIQYKQFNSVDPSGINGQGVYNGTSGPDRIFGGNDNDTFWGGADKDVIEGNGGDDVALGGAGSDIITDLSGADVLKGGPGNDALDGGIGDDIPMGGDGQDFTNGGANDNETFGGEGNDFILAGQGADAVFGDGGDDWIQGGTGQDLLIGDHAAPFFDDPAESKPGNDVFVGQTGENDYDAEGGDDLMSQNAAVDRLAGSGGFDWAIHQYNTVAADDDMAINNNLVGVPQPVVVNRDRWQEVEGNSGSEKDDVIRGDDDVPADAGGAGFTGCDVLDQTGVERIAGLNTIVPQPLTGALAPVVANSQAGGCPLTGPIWGEGNILLGGGGNDTITGRGADDIIDGDKSIRVRISVRTNTDGTGPEIGSADVMEHAYKTGSPNTLQADVFAGIVDPGQLVTVREIMPAPVGDTGVDTAVFLGPQADYTVTVVGNAVRVTQVGAPVAPQSVSDGTDTLRGIEKLKFSDVTVSISPVATVTPTAQAFGTRPINTNTTQTTNLTNTGNIPLSITSVAVVAGTDSSQFTRPTVAGTNCPSGASTLAVGVTCTIPIVFRPASTGPKVATLRITSNSGNTAGTQTDVPLSGTGIVNGPIVTLTPTAQAFGTQTVNTNTARTTVLRNTGNQNLALPNGSLTTVGANAADFTTTEACPNPVPANTQCNITTTFRPSAAGDRAATLRVTTNSSGVTGKIDTVDLTGTGQNGGIGLASANLTGTTLAFGNARRPILILGGTTVTRVLTVSSTGPAPLVVGTTPITGTNANQFSVTGNTCGVAARPVGGATCTISVRFAPTSTGAKTALLRINSNIPAGGTNINLTGTGTT
jgi:Ca2+-binding RTX toxin-like protein